MNKKNRLTLNVIIYSIVWFFVFILATLVSDKIVIDNHILTYDSFVGNINDYKKLTEYIGKTYPNNLCVMDYNNYRCRDENYTYMKDTYLQESLTSLQIYSIFWWEVYSPQKMWNQSFLLTLKQSIWKPISSQNIYITNNKLLYKNAIDYCHILDIDDNQSLYVKCNIWKKYYLSYFTISIISLLFWFFVGLFLENYHRIIKN